MYNVLEQYPSLSTNGRTFCLSIYPTFHTRLFPDSRLNNEPDSLVQDITYSNSIRKVYLTAMSGTEELKSGDNLLMYRTSDGQGAAYYRSVITGVCVVEDVKNIRSFSSYRDFEIYCAGCSVFTGEELKDFYTNKKYPVIIKFTYNIALKKRVTNGQLLKLMDAPEYWGFFPISNDTLKTVLRLGGV